MHCFLQYGQGSMWRIRVIHLWCPHEGDVWVDDMDIEDPDYYCANTFVYNKVGDIAWKKMQEKNRSNLVCCETSFSKNSYHIETSQLIWVAN